MEQETLQTGKIIPVPIEDEIKNSYLNYAMSVIVSRALPDVRDGLKPVHRRLLYAMDELGLKPNAATKKCARITGDAMGKYHPHGDLSLYDALVRMAQDFSLRYPLVQGQGNFGSIDGDPPAASRYTEAKLSRFGNEMLTDLDKETVDFGPNYDESLKEPLVLPSALPNLIVNGASGIAVGMTTNMPTHNLRETVAAICAFIDKPAITVDELMYYINGPDFPTGAIIYGRDGIKQAYRTGKGRVVIRAKFTIESLKNSKEQIVFTEIPYAVNKANLVKHIAELVRDRVIEGISDLRDESDREGLRIVLELKKDVQPKLILNKLFAHTALQSTFSVINLALVNGKPQVLTLKNLIEEFVKHRVDVVTRRTRYELQKAEERAHIVQGLIIAINNIDEVIRIIKSSASIDDAKAALISRFNLSEIQAQAIVDMRLGRLTGLEVERLETELRELLAKIAYYKELLADQQKLLEVIKKELQTLAEKYGDDRKTEIVDSEAESIDIDDLIKKEEMVIIISNKGFIKRLSVSAYKNQSRGGKGSNSANLIDDDAISQLFIANTHDYLLCITSKGKAYYKKVHEIPIANKTSRGAHVKGLLALDSDEEITAIVDIHEFRDDEYVLMGTRNGIVKKVATSEFVNAKTRGILAIKLDEGDLLVSACLTRGNDEVVLITRNGQALRIQEDTIRVMGRASRGVTGIKLIGSDELASMLRVNDEEQMLIITTNGFGKRIAYDNFAVHGRSTKGQRVYVPDEKTGEIAAALSLREEDDIVVMTGQGKTLKINVDTIRLCGKSAKGVRIVAIESPDVVVGIDRIVKEKDEFSA